MIVHRAGVLSEDVVAAFAGCVLQFVDRVRVEQMELALAAPLVLATHFERTVCPSRIGGLREGPDVALLYFLCDDIESDAAEPTGHTAEVLVDNFARKANDLKDLGARVGGHCGDAHLGHHLQEALVHGLYIVLLGIGQRDVETMGPGLDHLGDRLERGVREDSAGTKAQQRCDVMHFSRFARLDHEIGPHPRRRRHEVMMNSCGREERWNRSVCNRDSSVTENQYLCALGDSLVGLVAESSNRRSQSLAALVDWVDEIEHDTRDLGATRQQSRELVRGEHRVTDPDLFRRIGAGVQQVPSRTKRRANRGDQFLANGVERRVRNLREELLEVVGHKSRALGKCSDGRVGSHRSERLFTVGDHRLEQQFQFFVGVTKDELLGWQWQVMAPVIVLLGQVVNVGQRSVEDLAIGPSVRHQFFDFVVANDSTLLGVDQEDSSRFESSLLDDLVRVDVHDSDLGGHYDQAVARDPVARWA